MKEILVIASRPPFPVEGGDTLRLEQLSRSLAEFAEVTLITQTNCPASVRALKESSLYSKHIVYHLPTRLSRLARAGLWAISGRPGQVGYFYNRNIARYVRSEAASYDLIVCHLVRTVPYAKHVPSDRPVVLEMTDALSLLYERVIHQQSVRGIKKWVYLVDRITMRKYEDRALCRVDAAVLAAEQDRRWLRQTANRVDANSKVSIAVIPNGLRHCEPCKAIASFARSAPVAAFVGNCRSLQNKDAVRYFVDEVWPTVRGKVSDARFRIIGRGGQQLVKGRHSDGIEAVGFVDDLRGYLKSVACVVAPVRLGAGVGNKVLDALAYGVPIVASPVAARGLPAGVRSMLYLPGDSAEFAAATASLLVSERKREEALRAQAMAARELPDWYTARRQYAAFVRKVLDSHGHTA